MDSQPSLPNADTYSLQDSNAASAHVLIIEDLAPAEPGSDRSLRVLAAPSSPGLLFDGPNADEVCIVSLDAELSGDVDARGANEASVADPAGWAPSGVPILEPSRSATADVLLLINAPDSGVHVNGLPAPILSPLDPGDQITLASEVLVHVSRRQHVSAIPVPPELVGKPCSLCLCAFEPISRVVKCPKCDGARHLDRDDVPADVRMECAAIGACPDCETELPSSDQEFVYWPAEA
jgi:hypothetical protein